MPSADDLANFQRLRNNQNQAAIPAPPPLPPDLLERFPSMAVWFQQFEQYMVEQVGGVIQGPV